MNLSQLAWALYGGGALFLIGAWLFGRGKVRTFAANGLLAVLTIFVAHFLYVAFSTQRLGKSNPAVATDQAEMQLRLMACIDSLRRTAAKQDGLFNKLTAQDEKQKTEAFENAQKSLENAIQANSKSRMYPAKLVVILGENPNRFGVTRMRGVNSTLLSSEGTDEKYRELGKVFNHVYIEGEVSRSEVEPFADAIKKALPTGWYQDTALTELYEISHDDQKLKAHLNTVDQKNIGSLAKLMFFAVLLFLAGIIGAINILIQLAMTGRKSNAPPDAVGLKLPLKAVFAVFVGWFSVQILMSTAAHAFLAENKGLTSQPTAVALTTGITYLISNLPGPLLIYWLALRPSGQRFAEALRIKMRTSTSGPFKIVFMGILAWCSAIPVVFAAAWVATKYLGSGHSDNPVIGQIVQAASASNPLAIILFYFTLGVMAPVFEEILFRGFLYSALKVRIGAFLSMLASAAVFSIMHFDKGGVLMLFAIGFVLAFAFERTRSLVPSMIAHGLWNSGSFTLALFLFSN